MGAVPLLVSFGTGMLKRYNQRKQADTLAEYDQILLDAKNEQELKLLTESTPSKFIISLISLVLVVVNPAAVHLIESSIKYEE